MFTILSKMCDSNSINSYKVSDFKFLKYFWLNRLVKYITVLLLIYQNLSLDINLKLLIIYQNDIFENFNQNRKIEYC